MGGGGVFGYVRRVARLGPAGLVDLVVLCALAVVAEVGVRWLPLLKVARWFGVRLTGPPTASPGPPLTERLRRRRRIVEMLARHWPFVDRSGLCLRRALLFGWVLRDRDPLLRVGVARIDGALAAHAWLELEGATIGYEGAHQALDFDR